MILENMIRKEVREMPPSGIRKYFDIVNEMDDVISLGVGGARFCYSMECKRSRNIFTRTRRYTLFV